MLGRVETAHEHNTRAARAGLYLSAREHRSVGYRVPKEWATLSEVMRGSGSSTGFKRQSKREFLRGYEAFTCQERGCQVCGGQGGGSGVAVSQRGRTSAGREDR